MTERNNKNGLATVRNELGTLAHREGSLERARAYFHEARETFQELGEIWAVAVCQGNLARLALAEGNLPEAAAEWRDVLALRELLADPYLLVSGLDGATAVLLAHVGLRRPIPASPPTSSVASGPARPGAPSGRPGALSLDGWDDALTALRESSPTLSSETETVADAVTLVRARLQFLAGDDYAGSGRQNRPVSDRIGAMTTASPYDGTDWLRALARFEKSDPRRAARQLANTLIPYAALWAVMVYLLQHGYSYGWVLALSLLSGGMLVRVFIFFHDCCHQSFLPSKKANRFLGHILGVLVLTPFDDWRRPHALHHASAGDQDKRGFGDVWTLTVEEYKALPKKNQILYRLYRNPFVMLLLGPPYMFLLGNRFPHKCASNRESISASRRPTSPSSG